MIFLTVGTLFPFDRLVKAVDDAIGNLWIKQKVFAQIGKTEFKPRNMEYIDMLDTNKFISMVKDSEYLISHAGIGSIILALEHNKPLLVMPRVKRLREHVNDHQIATAKKFEEIGLILAVYDVKDLPDGISKLKKFVPRTRNTYPDAVVDRINHFLDSL